jgi:hypothetical protein
MIHRTLGRSRPLAATSWNESRKDKTSLWYGRVYIYSGLWAGFHEGVCVNNQNCEPSEDQKMSLVFWVVKIHAKNYFFNTKKVDLLGLVGCTSPSFVGCTSPLRTNRLRSPACRLRSTAAPCHTANKWAVWWPIPGGCGSRTYRTQKHSTFCCNIVLINLRPFLGSKRKQRINSISAGNYQLELSVTKSYIEDGPI